MPRGCLEMPHGGLKSHQGSLDEASRGHERPQGGIKEASICIKDAPKRP